MTTEYRDRKGKLLRVDHGTRLQPDLPNDPAIPEPPPAVPADETAPDAGHQEP